MFSIAEALEKLLQWMCFLNTARMSHSSDSPSWREDLEKARHVFDAQRLGFALGLAWLENWRIGQSVEPGREAARGGAAGWLGNGNCGLRAVQGAGARGWPAGWLGNGGSGLRTVQGAGARGGAAGWLGNGNCGLRAVQGAGARGWPAGWLGNGGSGLRAVHGPGAWGALTLCGCNQSGGHRVGRHKKGWRADFGSALQPELSRGARR